MLSYAFFYITYYHNYYCYLQTVPKKDSKIQSHMYDTEDPITIGSTPKVNTVNEKELHP